MYSDHVGSLARLSTILVLTTLGPACNSGGSASGGSTAGAGSKISGSGGSGGGDRSGTGGSLGGGSSGGSSDGVGSSSSDASSAGRGGNAGSSVSSGNTASGGGSGSGGKSGGGRTGSAGRTGSGGSGNSGTGPGSGASSGASTTFTVDVQLSSKIATVGIATWSLDVPVDSATIDFGRDQSNFELHAPVDLAADKHRTLLLGMKPDTTYYVKVTAKGGSQTYVSKVASIKTGYLSNGLPVQKVTDRGDKKALYAGGGFTVLCNGYTVTGTGTAGSSVAFIFDPDGEIIWAYDLSKTVAATCTRARMSLDGKYMWAGNFGNTTTDGALTRISMDGLGSTNDFKLPGRSHDFAVLPDDHIVYFARDNGGSGMSVESIMELDPSTGKTKLLYSEVTDFNGLFSGQGGHTNQVNYVPELKAISFSMYFINTVALISYPEGKLLASFGGTKSTFPNMTWNGQHGHDVFTDHFIVFNNNGTNGGASVLRFQHDLQAKSATKKADYSPGQSSLAFGDVKELPNGNYFVTYSTSSVMHEIDSSMRLLREVSTNVTIGYTEHRSTLYGPPPPYDRSQGH